MFSHNREISLSSSISATTTNNNLNKTNKNVHLLNNSKLGKIEQFSFLPQLASDTSRGGASPQKIGETRA